MSRRFVAMLVLVALTGWVFADDVRDAQDFRNKVRFHQATSVESGASLDIESGGSLKIAGTALTVSAEALNAAVGTTAGDVACDDINMSGTVGDTLGFNVTKAASVTGLAATVTMADVAGSGKDTDYVSFRLFTMANDSGEDIVWAHLDIVIDDNTTNTEDSAAELYLPVAGVDTKVLDFTAGVLNAPVGLQVGGANVYSAGGTDVAVADGGTGASTAAGARTNLAVVIDVDVQAYDADLTTYAGITPSANAQALLALTYAAMRTNLSLTVDVDVQAHDADLDALASKTISFLTLTNLVYDGGATTGNVNIVSWQ